MAEIVFAAGLLLFTYKRLLRYLRYYQQEEYFPKRFIAWLQRFKAYDRRGSFAALLGVTGLICSNCLPIVPIIQGTIFAVLYFSESDPRLDGKKKLVVTQRAQAIFGVALILAVMLLAVISMLEPNVKFIAILVYVQLPPFFLMLAVLLLKPREKAIQNRLKKEAHDKFVSINPFSIGVTGSFGKTSVKNLLGEILSQSLGPTFWPQAGVNTEMGITREIRERMNTFDRYAVVEMGAYHRGSISRLCRLTPIKAGIVTAVHLMHLERFGSEEDIYQAKSELAQNVPQDGILIVNGDNPGARRMAAQYPKRQTLLFGLDRSLGTLDVYLSDIVIAPEGTSFVISWKGSQYKGFTKMHGTGALLNLLACFTMACSLGADPEVVLAVIRNVAPVSNRLEVKRYGNFTQINDAYNSNPLGFYYALQVLKELPGARRILMTPGMIELGDKTFEENRAIAKQAAQICQLVIVVSNVNKEAWSKGLADGGLPSNQVQYFETRDEALKYFNQIRQEGDILLLENDLPDVLEFTEVF